MEEIRRAYDYELDRKNSLETKASALFGLVAIIVTIQTFTLNYLILITGTAITTDTIIVVGGSLLGVSLSFVCLLYLLQVINLEFTRIPYEKNPNKMNKSTSFEIKLDYRRSIFHTSLLNTKKVHRLKKARNLILAGIMLTIFPFFYISFFQIGKIFVISIIVITIILVFINISYYKLFNKPDRIRPTDEEEEDYELYYEDGCSECNLTSSDFDDNDLIFFCPKCKVWICPECYQKKHQDHKKGKQKRLDYLMEEGKPK